MDKLSHFDDAGNVKMVDVSAKDTTNRKATAVGSVLVSQSVIDAVRSQTNPKGDPLEIARIAGIMAAKRTSELIPLCHQINLTSVDVRIEIDQRGFLIEAEAATSAQTGVEMEALTAVSVAALTIYDMCKSIQKDMVIGEIKVIRKSGGRSDIG
jgi:cyclic pyranopterin phosphate synthase